MSKGWKEARDHLTYRLRGVIGQAARILRSDISCRAAHPANSAADALSDGNRMAADLLRGRMRADGRAIDAGDRTDIAAMLNERRPLCEAIENRAEKLFGHAASIARYDLPGGGRIWYSAQMHAKKPEHVQYPLIRRVFEIFVNEPNGRRRIALNEQNVFSDDEVRGLDLDDAVRGGDHLHVKALAVHHGIRGELGDIEPIEFLTRLDPGRERLHHVWQFLNNVKHMHNQVPPPAVEEIIEGLRKWTADQDANLRATGCWPNADGPQMLTYDDLTSWYEEYLDERFDPTRNIRDMLNPNLMDTSNPVNEIVRYRVNERETGIMDSIDAWNRRGYDVFVGQGASHYTIQKELLQQRYGEPLTYRPGQMSGNLLIDGPKITPDDIRQGVAVTEERVARAENPIDKALLSEELRALQYELAQRL